MRLVGFVNPYNYYPAVVIPVWRDDSERIFGAYLSPVQGSRDIQAELVPLEENARFHSLPSDWEDSSVAGCQPHEVCLFALSHESLIAYPLERQREILSSLLEDPGFSASQPFSRLAVAKCLGDIQLVIAEVLSAACHLLSTEVAEAKGGARQRVENWLLAERRSVCDQFEGSPEFTEVVSDFPKSLDDFGAATWWRRHLTTRSRGLANPLHRVEDRQPSPKAVAVLNRQPIVPSKVLLEIMARHLRNGTNYLFFHSPGADRSTLSDLREATDKVLKSATESAAGPLSHFQTPSIGRIQFYKLEREWTGSPYVFYEELQSGKIRVVGYRGLDVGASIAHLYVALPDNYAYELLEALSTNMPQPERIEATHPERGKIQEFPIGSMQKVERNEG